MVENLYIKYTQFIHLLFIFQFTSALNVYDVSVIITQNFQKGSKLDYR